MATIRLTRDELYHRVWSEPIQHLAKAFGLSDVGLAKLCRRHRIPVPGRGYWQKKANGRPVRQVPLQPLPNPVEIFIRPEPPLPAPPPQKPPEELHQAVAFERDPKNRIEVPQRLSRPHSLLVSTKKEWLRVQRRDWTSPEHDALDLRISKEAESRAFRIMHALLIGLERRGYKIKVEDRGTFAEVLGERIQFHLREGGKMVRGANGPLDYEERQRLEKKWWGLRSGLPLTPTGQLSLRTGRTHYGKDQFADRKDKKLEDCLNGFIEELVREALDIKQRRAAHEEQQRRWEEAERRRLEEEQRIQKWNTWMENWRKAQDIRAFAAAMREAFEPIAPGGEVEGWLAWAAKYADSIDPLPKSTKTP